MDATKFSITKSTVECYKIRHESGMYWADITIDAKDHTGRIQIASDYGDWQYHWGACGETFKHFLAHLNIDYVAGKFGENDHFDEEKTIAMYRQYVKDNRKDKSLTAAEARSLMDDIKYLQSSGANKLNDFLHVLHNECHALVHQFDHQPDTVTTISPQFRMFWDNVWKFFITELKKEL